MKQNCQSRLLVGDPLPGPPSSSQDVEWMDLAATHSPVACTVWLNVQYHHVIGLAAKDYFAKSQMKQIVTK